MTPDEIITPSSGGNGIGEVVSSNGETTSTKYEWGSDPYVDNIIAQFPVADAWNTVDVTHKFGVAPNMVEWWSWALYYTRGLFQPLIQSMILCAAIKTESGGVRDKHSGFINKQGVLEDSVGLFQMYRFGAGASYVPELHDGIDLRKKPAIQFAHMTPNFNSKFVRYWNEGMRGEDLVFNVCGHVEGSEEQFWHGYVESWRELLYYLPWASSLQEGF